MKALQCIELGGPEKLVVNEIEDPKIQPGHIIIDVKAASVNFPDVLMIQGLYQFQPPMPFIPGAECSGVIAEIGEGVDSCSIGDHVFVMAGNGCFAEKLVVEAARVSLIPKEMDFPVAAALPMTYGTSLYALKQRANLQPGETLLVLGAAGGVGLSAVELGKSMGAKVIAAASSEEKIKIGLIVPLSGEYKEIGNSIVKSARLAINKIDDSRIEIIPRDTKSNPETTLKVSKELYNNGVKIIIGPIFNKNLINFFESKRWDVEWI